jgi:hypothetical protein
VSYLQPGILRSRPVGERLVDVLRAVRVSWEASGSRRVATLTRSGAVPQREAGDSALSVTRLPDPHRSPIALDPDWIDEPLPVVRRRASGLPNAEARPSCPLRGHVLRARLLGAFEVHVDGVEITDWYGQLGPAILRFLLAQPTRTCGRDVLLEQFWPGAEPQRARNRLHVALTALRQAMRAATTINVVQFQDGVYRIAPEFEVHIDVDGADQRIDDDASALRDHALALS